VSGAVRIAWRHLEPSEPVEALVRKKAARLQRLHERMTSCAVTLELAQRRQKQGKHFRVRIEIGVPGGKRLVVGRDPRESRVHEDLVAAVHAAFSEVRRQLEDRVRRLDHRVKTRLPPPRARVARVFPEEGYGFLRTPEGREIYFHERSVVGGGFDRLEVGVSVRYAEEMGREGPQASSVVPLRAARRAAGATRAAAETAHP